MWPILAALGGSALSFLGQQQANETNRSLAHQQMDFQERMSSTAYQRARADMEHAGLNPILAATQGGASTPAGSTGAPQQDIFDGAPQSAIAAMKVKEELDNLRSTNKQIDSSTALNKEMAKTQRAEQGLKSASTAYTTRQTKNASLQTPGLQNEADLQDTVIGKILPYLKHGTSTAKGTLPLFRGMRMGSKIIKRK